MKYWRWRPLTWGKMTKFARWREFQCFAAPPWSFLITHDLSRRFCLSVQVRLFSAGASKQTIVEQNFRAFRLHFRFPFKIVTIVFDIRPSVCWEIRAGGYGWAAVLQKNYLRQNLVASRSGMKFENFMKYWGWWPLTRGKIIKFARWREFQCVAAPPWLFQVADDL